MLGMAKRIDHRVTVTNALAADHIVLDPNTSFIAKLMVFQTIAFFQDLYLES